MFRFSIFLLLINGIYTCALAQTLSYPQANKSDHQDTYFQKTIQDPYRWLEDYDSDKTKNWLQKQTTLTENYRIALKKAGKIQNALQQYNWSNKYNKGVRIEGFFETSKTYTKFKYYIYRLIIDRKKAAPLYFDSDKYGFRKLIFNPNEYKNYQDEIVSVESYLRSPNEKFLAIFVSRSGSDWREIYIYDFEQRKLLPEKIKNIKFSQVEWLNDNSFFYIDHTSIENHLKDRASNRTLKLHKLYNDIAQDKVIYKSIVGNNGFSMDLNAEKTHLFIYDIRKIRQKNYRTISYINTHPDSSKLPKVFLSVPFENKADMHILSLKNNVAYIYTNYKAKNHYILKQNINEVNQAQVLIPQRKDPMIEAYDLGKYFLGLYLSKSYQYCIIYDRTGKIKMKLDFPEGTTAGNFRANHLKKDIIYYEISSFKHDEVIYELNVNKLRSAPMHALGVDYKFGALVTKVVFYKSKDGTEVPMYITHKKNITLDGTNPTILYAYGGFGVPMTPFYNPGNIILFDSGGILAVPTIRGGGELGSDWHKQGSLLQKQNSFDDFIYAAKYLIKEKYTNPSKLAIRGASNGGLLVSAVMCQAPDLFQAVVAENGVYDMLRFQKFTAGVFWVNEYGSVKDEKQFENLFSYSPLHNLKKGTRYPAVLVSTGDNDDRVTPLHSYKFLATLQEKGDKQNPYLLHLEKQTGHNSPEVFKQWLESESFILQFIFDQLGNKLKVY